MKKSPLPFLRVAGFSGDKMVVRSFSAGVSEAAVLKAMAKVGLPPMKVKVFMPKAGVV